MSNKITAEIALGRYEMFQEAAAHLEVGGDRITENAHELSAMPYVIKIINREAGKWLKVHASLSTSDTSAD